MVRRVITAVIWLLVALPAVLLGGFFFFALMSLFVVMAAYEYVHMFRARGHHPALGVTAGGTFLLLIARAFFPESAGMVLTGLILVALTIHLLDYERGRNGAALDFTITAAGIIYLGWIGAYLYDLRALPNGGWWTMLVLPTVWMADTAAYMIGARYGRHKMAPRLSPKKSWEGYLAGVLTGTFYGGFFAWAYSWLGPLQVTVGQGMLLGWVLSSLTALGDLGESLFKRESGLKDSGAFFPGHGGAFDRIDSWLWAAVIGVYWIRTFFL